ncbi:lytic transglycosylase, partial [Acinetobacter baumannii]
NWLARATEQRGDSNSKNTAQLIYKKLAESVDDYHNLLEKDRIGVRYNHQPYNDEPTASDLRRLDQNIHFNRAFTIRRINANPTYTNREWNWAVRKAYLQHDDGLLLA